MRKNFFKVIGAMALTMCLAMGYTSNAAAQVSDNWSINYTPGAPSGVGSTQIDVLHVAYSSAGQILKAKTLSGTNGRRLVVTSAQKMAERDNQIELTYAPYETSFKMSQASASDLTFYVTANQKYKTISTGTIKRK